MSNSDEINNVDSNNINTRQVVKIIGFIVLGVVGFYFVNFHNGFSKTNGDWGTFGDYVGGILNPVIAAFAFYLIAETYKLQTKAYDLQKTELEETRKLLKVSTDAQSDQVKLAALTALLNSNLTNMSILQSEKASLLSEFITSDYDRKLVLRFNELEYLGQRPESLEYLAEYEDIVQEIMNKKGEYYFFIIQKVRHAEDKIRMANGENELLKKKIESFLK